MMIGTATTNSANKLFFIYSAYSQRIPTCHDESALDANGNCPATIAINKDAQQLQSDTPQPDHDHKPSKHKHHKGGDG